MSIESNYLYAVVQETPDYTNCQMLTVDRDEATYAAGRVPGGKVYELDLGAMALWLIREGYAKEV